jgi:hypothetical protein
MKNQTTSRYNVTIFITVFCLYVLSPTYGQWQKNVIDENIDNPASMTSGDIDGDGDVDIAATIYGDADLVWYENDNKAWTKHIIDGNIGGVGVFIADIDGDDTLDVALAGFSANMVKWYKNEGGSPITWTPYTIDNNLSGAEWVYVADIDCDDDPDVVATGYKASDVVWYENGGGMPISWTKDTIDANLGGALVCYVVDIDGDDTLDVVATGNDVNDVVWYKNENAGQNWTKFAIDDNLGGANESKIADIDSDDDPDVVATGNNANDVVWYENGGGAPVSWTKHTIDANLGGAFAVSIADIDTNGTLDVVATGNSADDVVWYANDGGSPIGWSKSIIDADLNGAWAVIVSDIDDNSFPDVIVNQWITNGSIVWYENPFPVGVEQMLNTKTIKIYPNPANDRLTIETNKSGLHTIEITSLKGQLIYNSEIEGPILQLELSSFPKGVYFITVKFRDYVRTNKIIKL